MKTEPTPENIQALLVDVRPALALHAGDIELVKFEAGTVYVRMLGMCSGCPLSQVTLRLGIQEYLRSKLEGVERVEAV